MSLLEKASMLKMYLKNRKKSIHPDQHNAGSGAGRVNRIDIFILIALAILIITPVVFLLFNKIESGSNQVSLYLSSKYEEIFGNELMNSLLIEFEEKAPNILVRVAYNAFPAEPDVFILNEGEYNALAAAGSLLELNSLTNYESGTVQLAIPLISNMNLLFYNINILTAAGFDHPPKTRDEFAAYAKKVAGGDFNAAGAAISLSPDDKLALSRDIFSWIWANGNNFWSEEGSLIINTRAIINDITFLGGLYRDGSLAAGIFETTGEKRVEQFAQGKTAMMVASVSAIPYLKEKMGENAFGVTTIPGTGAGGKYSINLSSIYIGINSSSEHIEEAWDFLVFLAEKSSLLCAELKAVPGVRSDIIPGDFVRDDPIYTKAWDIFESSQIVEGFTGKPGAEQYEAVFLEELRNFFNGSRSAQETAAAIQRKWDEIYAGQD